MRPKAYQTSKLLSYAVLSLCLVTAVPEQSHARGGLFDIVRGLFKRGDNANQGRQASRTTTRRGNQADDTMTAAELRTAERLEDEAYKNSNILLGRGERDKFYDSDFGYIFEGRGGYDLVRTVGQRQAMHDLDVALKLDGKIGLHIGRRRGMTDNQIYDMVEFMMRKKSLNGSGKKAYAVTIDAGAEHFENIGSFKKAIEDLIESKALEDVGEIVFAFKNIDQYVDKVGFNLDNHIDTLYRLVRNANIKKVNGRDVGDKINVKSLFIGPRASFEKLISRQTLEDAFATVRLNGDLTELDKNEIIRRNLEHIDPQNNTRMTDAKINYLALAADRYLPARKSHTNALEAYERAVARRTVYMDRASDVPPVSKLAQELQKNIDELEEKLRTAGQLNGKYAQDLQQSLPAEIARLKKIRTAETRHHRALVRLRESIFKLEDELAWYDRGLNSLQKNTRKYRQLVARLERVRRIANIIGKKDLAIEIAEMSGRNVSDVLKLAGRMSLEDFRKLLDDTIYGQEQLKDALMRTAETITTALDNKVFPADRSLYNILITGVPGSGKTQGMNLLAEYVDDIKFFAGGELQEQHAISEVIGSPTGYVGSERGSPLGNLAKEAEDGNKVAMAQVDEVEKVHNNIINMLNGGMDPGELKLGGGEMTDSNHLVFSYTSNAITEPVGDLDMADPAVVKRLLLDPEHGNKSRNFTPEFVNRLDEVIFLGANPRQINSQILTKFLDMMNDDIVIKGKNIQAKLSDSARKKLLDIAHTNRNTSARDVRGALRQNFDAPLKQALRQNSYRDALSGTPHELTINPGEYVTLDFDEARGFFMVAE